MTKKDGNKKMVEPYPYEWEWKCPNCKEKYWGDFPKAPFKCSKCKQQYKVKCPECNGDGWYWKYNKKGKLIHVQCDNCNYTGWVKP